MNVTLWGLMTRELTLGKTLDIIGPTMKLAIHGINATNK